MPSFEFFVKYVLLDVSEWIITEISWKYKSTIFFKSDKLCYEHENATIYRLYIHAADVKFISIKTKWLVRYAEILSLKP